MPAKASARGTVPIFFHPFVPPNGDHGGMAETKARMTHVVALPLGCAVLLWTGLWGCERGDINGPTSSADCQQLMSAICNRLAMCDPVDLRQQYGDLATCTARHMLACSSFISPGTAWSSGKIQRCVAQMNASTDCYDDVSRTGACVHELGTLSDGTACQRDLQCAGGQCDRTSVTSPDGGSSRPACGVCSRPDAGISIPTCGDGGTCQPSERCLYDGTPPSPRCVLPQPEGAPCIGGGCAGALFCNRSQIDAGASICVKRGGVGAICTSSDECLTEAGLRCASGVCAVPTFGSLGERCDFAARLCESGTSCPYPALLPPNDLLICRARATDGSHCHEILGPHCSYLASCLDGICQLPRDAECR
jgi:hypothetical protein